MNGKISFLDCSSADILGIPHPADSCSAGTALSSVYIDVMVDKSGDSIRVVVLRDLRKSKSQVHWQKKWVRSVDCPCDVNVGRGSPGLAVM